MSYKTDTIIDLAEDYMDDFYAGEYNNIILNTNNPFEYMMHIKFPRQSGHTTALKYLDEKYNCYIIGQNAMQLQSFNIKHKSWQQFATQASDKDVRTSYRGYRDVIKPHVILIENYSMMDQNWVNQYITEYFEALSIIYRVRKACPIIAVN